MNADESLTGGATRAARAARAARATIRWKVLASTTLLRFSLITLDATENLAPLTMRWQLFYIILAPLGFVQSITDNGRRLLVVIEEIEKKDDYSELWADLKGIIGLVTREAVKADFGITLRARF